LSSKLDVAK